MNNIYFDKLPETIAKSSNEDDVNTTEVRMWFKSDVKISTLADRLAEERKRVVQEIREKMQLVQMNIDDSYDYELGGNDDWVVCVEDLNDILDQIERNIDG